MFGAIKKEPFALSLSSPPFLPSHPHLRLLTHPMLVALCLEVVGHAVVAAYEQRVDELPHDPRRPQAVLAHHRAAHGAQRRRGTAGERRGGQVVRILHGAEDAGLAEGVAARDGGDRLVEQVEAEGTSDGRERNRARETERKSQGNRNERMTKGAESTTDTWKGIHTDMA